MNYNEKHQVRNHERQIKVAQLTIEGNEIGAQIKKLENDQLVDNVAKMEVDLEVYQNQIKAKEEKAAQLKKEKEEKGCQEKCAPNCKGHNEETKKK